MELKDDLFQQELQAKYQRLQSFIEGLGDEKRLPVSRDLVEQFDIDEAVYRNLTAETVMQEAGRRIEK